jgi:hypothetical protein
LLQLRPGIERLVIDFVDDVVEVQPCESGYQSAVEPRFDPEDLVQELGGVALSCGVALASCENEIEFRL